MAANWADLHSYDEYMHDPLGRRIAKKVDGVITEKYLWQGLTRLLAVYNADDTLKMRFEYADARMPVAMTKGLETYYLGYDQVGTLKVVADASGNVVKRIEYDAFGNIISDSDDSFAVPFGFAGGLHDRDTGLVRFGYRDYDPETGRWTAKDPILFAGGDTDLYGYCVNDPVNWSDSDGLNPKDKHYGLPKKFWNWYHRNVKEKGDPDATKEEAEELYKEWMDLGKPGPDKKKKRKKGKFKVGIGGCTTVDAYCARYPQECAELLGDIVENAPDQSD